MSLLTVNAHCDQLAFRDANLLQIPSWKARADAAGNFGVVPDPVKDALPGRLPPRPHTLSHAARQVGQVGDAGACPLALFTCNKQVLEGMAWGRDCPVDLRKFISNVIAAIDTIQQLGVLPFACAWPGNSA